MDKAETLVALTFNQAKPHHNRPVNYYGNKHVPIPDHAYKPIIPFQSELL